MITTNQQFPYTEESLTITFSPWETAQDVADYLAINGVLPKIVTPEGALVSHPDEYDGEMLMHWDVPQLAPNDEGELEPIYEVVDGVSVIKTFVVTASWFKKDTNSLDLNIPVGCVLHSLEWLQPYLQSIPIRWITKQGQKYFPVTHVDAVIDSNGNKISSVITWCREEVLDYGNRMRSMEAKLLKPATNYGTLTTTVSDGSPSDPTPGLGYLASGLQTLYIDDQLHIPEDPNTPDRKVILADEDGNIIGQYPLPLDYTLTEDSAFYIYTDTPITDGINFSTQTLVVRAGSGSNVSFIESNNMLTINDNDHMKTYQVAKANTLVKADGTTIKAVTSADGITKTISVADDLQGAIYDKTTGALSQKNLGTANSSVGRNSVAFGEANKSLNASETALGQFNVSHDNGDTDAKSVFYGDNEHTLATIGAGLSNTNRFNAIEVMQDGTVYIKGVGGYDGKSLTNPDLQSLQDVLGESNAIKCYGPFDDLDTAIATLGPADQDLMKAGIHFTVTQDDGTLKEYIALKDDAADETEVMEIGAAIGETGTVGDFTLNLSAGEYTSTPITLKKGQSIAVSSNFSLGLYNDSDALVDASASGKNFIYTATDDIELHIFGVKDDMLTDPHSASYCIFNPLTTGEDLARIINQINDLKANACKGDEITITKNADNTFSLIEDSIAAAHIHDNAITSAKLATDSVNTTAIQNGAVTSDKLATNSVSTTAIQNGAVTEDKLAGGSVTEAKLATGAVTAGKLATDSVITIKIADNAVTKAKLADNAVETAKIKDGAITEDKLDDDLKDAIANAGSADNTTLVKNTDGTMSVKDSAISTAKLADSAVTSAKLATDSVNTTAIQNGAVTEAKLATDAVTTTKIKDANVTEAKLATDAVTTTKIKDSNVTEAKLATDSVTTTKIKDSNVTEAKLATDSVTTAKIKDSNVTEAKLATDSVTTAKIKDAQVTKAKLATDAISYIEEKNVTLEVAATTTTGYLKTYDIKQNNVSIGKIDIPKDFLVKSGEVKTSTAANNPQAGFAAGDKYLDLVLNTQADDDTDSHIYINLKDLNITIDSALSATSENPVQNKVVDAAIKALDLTEVGGTGKLIKAVSETDGVVSATAIDAVTKATTPTTGSFATYTIGDSTTKVEIPFDTLVVAAEYKTCTTAGTPTGMAKDEIYLDLTINDKDKTQTESHIYASTGRFTEIDLSANVFAASPATPSLPTGYALADLAARTLYTMDGGSKYQVNLDLASKTFWYTKFDGTNLSVVSSSF